MDVEIHHSAHALAAANAEAEPSIEEIYWFPSATEIRLVELDRNMMRSGQVVPFYFGPDPAGGVRFPSAIALIHPDERHLQPPDGWGRWEDAERIWPQGH